jgi:hypothetical protein
MKNWLLKVKILFYKKAEIFIKELEFYLEINKLN